MAIVLNRLRYIFKKVGSLWILKDDGIWPPGFALNDKRMAREVDELASAAGRENLPAPDAPSPDNNETQIESDYREALRTLYAWYQDKLQHEQLLRAQATTTFDVKSFEAHYQAALGELTALKATYGVVLTAARKEEQQRFLALRAFRAQRGIMREADYPAQWHVYRALPAVLVLVEAIANCHFFAIGSTQGLFGGLQEALLVAALNIALSYHVGVALRSLPSSGMRRLVSGTIGGLYTVGLGLFHLAVGHYRTALAGSNPDSAAFIAIETFTRTPLALTDFHSWVLVLVGMLSGIGAALCGYKADDPSPGYGAITRRYKTAVAAYHRLKEQYLLGIQEAIEAQIETVDHHLEEAKTAMHTYLESLAESRRLILNYNLASAVIDNKCSAMLRRYRAVNKKVRTLAEPPYFREELHSPLQDELKALALPDVAELTPDTADFKQALDGLQDKVADLKRQLQELYQMWLNEAPKYFAMIEESADTGHNEAS